jgi:hypothetical protein
VTRSNRLTRDDYQAAMASLEWENRRRIELASHRGGPLEDPTHAALAAERGRRVVGRMYWGLLLAPLALYLLWSWLETGSTPRLWLGGFCLLVLVIVGSRILVYQRARWQHLENADFEGLRAVAHDHRTTYRRRD